MPERSPLFWTVAALRSAYAAREISPVEVTEEALSRIAALDANFNAFVSVSVDQALDQARAAEKLFARPSDALPPLLGIPVSIKDLFVVRGSITTFGSKVHQARPAQDDSLMVARLRNAGAVFVGKTNTAEFGQSATTDNMLGPETRTPWDPARTSGGSSGGAGASVAAGLATLALGSDGGGSVRIPAAFCGVCGIKPTYGAVPADSFFSGMSDFVCPGPLARTVADARAMLEVLLDTRMAPTAHRRLRIGLCLRPEGRPVDPGVVAAVAHAGELFRSLGHEVVDVSLPVEGWADAFGPLILVDEWRRRRDLLDGHVDDLTPYARASIRAGGEVKQAEKTAAREAHDGLRGKVAALFEDFDVVVTPTTAVPPFPAGDRPSVIDGTEVDRLWGPFPFTAAWNVAGVPVISLPCGLVEGLPVGIQLVGAHGAEATLLEFAEEVEGALAFPSQQMEDRWGVASALPVDDAATRHVTVERDGDATVISLARPAKRNALTVPMLRALRDALRAATKTGSTAVILRGTDTCFSAGMDLAEVHGDRGDAMVDEQIAATARAIKHASVPVIAAVDGPCIGAALELLLACDVRVAGEGSTFALPATRLGLLYRLEGLDTLVRELGIQTALRLTLLGDTLSVGDAVTSGLIACVAPEGGALAAALELARRAGGADATAVARTKAYLREREADRADLEAWEAIRLEALDEPARREAVARANGRTRTSVTS